MYIRKYFIFVQCYRSSFYVIDKNLEIYKKRLRNFKKSFINNVCVLVNKIKSIVLHILYTYYISI